ncbi:acyl-CoA dehydrogenase family protein [Cellulomonas wangsupingiae]|uniref:acyl-CoA dehydrogenase family protein n=1 Tax=Cellulomonas wangsupingiae TaxID=2968085 RepID=UPI001D0EA286|nr:acyl-CoA dehydrogenase family protein [Cellulomonas wangsupingiae]MCM0640406.1 acyl-CoA dehydrogenase family protein [Cellulomonas wangsupingiae]
MPSPTDLAPDLASGELRAAVVEALCACAPGGTAHSRAVWSQLGRAGVLAAVAGREGSRPGVDLVLLRALLTTLDAHAPLGVVLSTCVQVATVLPLLADLADDDPDGLAAEVRDRALRGDVTVALAVTDAAAAGSDLLDSGTSVTPRADDVLLAGGKRWITNAVSCDYALTLVRHRPARHFTSFRWALVPAGAPGVVIAPAAPDLFAAADVGHVDLHDVRLDREHLTGRAGRALPDFARHVGVERLASGMWAAALCRRVLTDLYAWLTAPPPRGAARWGRDAVRERFARCLVEVERLDALLTVVMGRGVPVRAVDAMVVKVAAGQAVEMVLDEAVHLRGADAFRDGGEARLRAQAAMFSVAGGASGAMLAGVADHARALLEARP